MKPETRIPDPESRAMSLILYGRHAVLAALHQPGARLEEVFVAQGVKGSWLGEARYLARAAGARRRMVERTTLDRLCGTSHHQGIAARRGEYAYLTLPEMLDRVAGLAEPALLVAADGLTDPMNLGNLARSALAAGAHGLIIPRDRAVGVTVTVIKAAAGALEFGQITHVLYEVGGQYRRSM